jgi:Holliday junction DNA helicase RuvB
MLERDGIPNEISTEISKTVWSIMKSKDIRDCIKIGHLAKSKEDVSWIVNAIRNYK